MVDLWVSWKNLWCMVVSMCCEMVTYNCHLHLPQNCKRQMSCKIWKISMIFKIYSNAPFQRNKKKKLNNKFYDKGYYAINSKWQQRKLHTPPTILQSFTICFATKPLFILLTEINPFSKIYLNIFFLQFIFYCR